MNPLPMETESFAKLRDYKEVNVDELRTGDHFRYTSNKYQEHTRKCCYGIVKNIQNGVLQVGGYKTDFPDWHLDPKHKYKQYRFYKKTSQIIHQDGQR